MVLKESTHFPIDGVFVDTMNLIKLIDNLVPLSCEPRINGHLSNHLVIKILHISDPLLPVL